MGKTIRWFKNLMEKKKQKEQSSYGEDKRRWSLPTVVPEIEAEAVLVKSHYNKTVGELNKQAIAVVTATAAAVDAALVAAYASAEMARLTIDGRKTIFVGDRERWAAVKIQSIFRGYLARKALRALKGVVKVQAHIRGFLVRKRAASTLRRMQALMRTKQAILSQRAQQRTFIENFDRTSREHRSSIQPRRQSSSFNLVKSPEIVDMNICRAISRSRRTNASPLQRPNYMTNTQSFMAKVKSSPGRMGKDESRANFSRAEMERSCSRVEKTFYLKNAGLARLEKLRGVC